MTGIIQNSYKINNGVSVEVSSVWYSETDSYYNKAANLLDWNVCDDCRWWSNNIANSYVIYTFPEPFLMTGYSMQCSGIGVYPVSWIVSYTKDCKTWNDFGTFEPKEHFKEKFEIKKFKVHPTYVKRVKFTLIKNNLKEGDGYYNCFNPKKIDFFSEIRRSCYINNNQYLLSVFIIHLFLICLE